MVGGNKNAYDHCDSIFKSLATDGKGYGYMGPSGTGHFVKMIHNAFEYGMMGKATAIAWLLFVVILFITLIQTWLQRRWVHYES